MNDRQKGKGKETWPDSSFYEGDFKAGKKHGRGRYVWADGSRFEGDFEDN